jgi:hypothetical protein
LHFFALALTSLSFVGCEAAPSRMAAHILERYRKASGAKPLPAGGMIRIRLSRPEGAPGETGREELLWELARFRDTVESAGMTTVRGIESERAYFIDGDGVTRVASEPAMRELLTRSYFWRRAWLFRDREKALLRLGPADGEAASIRLDVLGGNPLVLAFSSRDGRLLSVRSPRFHLEFQSPTRYRDLSDPSHPVDAEIAWTGLPTGRMPATQVGGGRAVFAEASTRVSAERRAGALVVDARISGTPVRLALDASADGPLVLSRSLAARLPLRFATDVFGRSLAPGATLQIGAASWPGLFVEARDGAPEGADAVAGACVFREAVVEIDLRAGRLGLHDPARWVAPEAYVRLVTDDDGDRPVVTLNAGSAALRLAEGSDTGDAAVLLSADSAARAGLTSGSRTEELRWGPLLMPPLSVRIAEGFSSDWGDDGRLGFAIFEHAHAYIDMPQRWTYLKPHAAE